MTESEARAIAAPDSHWPLSEDARRWVESAVVTGTAFLRVKVDGTVEVEHIETELVYAEPAPTHERQFDREAYEQFMKELGGTTDGTHVFF